MFKVQRFTAEDEEEEGGSGTGGRVDESSNILNKVLERAKARASAKRARLVPSSNGVQHQADTVASQLERKSGTKFALNSGSGGRDGADVSRGGQSLTAAGSSKDRAGGAVQEQGGGTSEDDGDSSEEEESSSGESSSEDDESGDSREEKDAEILPTAESGTKPQGSSAAEGVGEDQEVGGQGLRPMEEVAEEWGLDSRLTDTLREEGVKHFFPIQVRVVPDIVATERHSHVQSRDICVSAPTGSGKTLVFVLGVLQALIRRRVVRLRALVLLPSRDLAMQVHTVFKRYARGTGLRVGLAIGQTNFLEEQLSLVGAVALEGNPVAAARSSFLRAQGRDMGPDPTQGGLILNLNSFSGEGARMGGSSEVDIVVATPGRLLDHLAHTPGFTLQHLRYLVIDEADRLLNQSYQGWVGKVIKAAYRREPGKAGPVYDSKTTSNETRLPATDTDCDNDNDDDDHVSAANGNSTGTATNNNRSKRQRPEAVGIGKRPRTSPLLRPFPSAVMLDPVTVRGRPLAAGDRVRGATVSTPPLRKLLFSATLTNNPQKLAGLDVVNPLIYTAREKTRRGDGGDESKRPSQETRRSNLDEISLAAGGEGGIEGRFSTPATLEETYTVCDSQAKPLVLLSLLREMIGKQTELAVIFTSSVDSTHRLFRLLQLFGGFEGIAAPAEAERGGEDSVLTTDVDDTEGGVAEFSSSLAQRQRSRIIRRARAGVVRVIVCSDGMARGMDLDGVGLVVNYDVPSQAKTYVHRVGRTARAGSRGMAVTITKKGQVKQFIKMRSSVDGKRVRLDPSPAEQSRILQLAGRYQRCLKDLKQVLEAEKMGELGPSAPVTATESY